MNHKYSTFALLLFLLVGGSILVLGELTSEEVDNVCNQPGTILYRSLITGLWGCANLTDVVVNYTVNNITYLVNNFSVYSNKSNYWGDYLFSSWNLAGFLNRTEVKDFINWTNLDNIYLYNNSNVINFNETKLNNTVSSIILKNSTSNWGLDNDTLRNVSGVESVNTSKYILFSNVSNASIFSGNLNVSGVSVSNVSYIGDKAITQNTPAPPYSNERLMSFYKTDSTTTSPRAGFIECEYNGTSVTTNNCVGLNAGVVFSNSGGSNDTSASGNVGGRYFVRFYSTAIVNVTSSASFQHQSVGIGSTGTLVEGALIRMEIFAGNRMNIFDAYGAKFEGASKNAVGTFRNYTAIYLPYNAEGTTTTPTNYNSIFFARNGVSDTTSIHFGEKGTKIGSAFQDYVTINATNTTFSGGVMAQNYFANNGTVGFSGTCTISGITSIKVVNGLITGCA